MVASYASYALSAPYFNRAGAAHKRYLMQRPLNAGHVFDGTGAPIKPRELKPGAAFCDRSRPATDGGRRALSRMTRLMYRLAGVHDRWFEQPAFRHALSRLARGWRHLATHHPALVAAFQWGACALVGGLLVGAELIANV